MSDQFDYTPEMVLSLLPQAFDRQATPKRDEDEGHSRCGDPALGGNYLAHLADVRQGLGRLLSLDPVYWHAHGEPSEEGARDLEILTRIINGKA